MTDGQKKMLYKRMKSPLFWGGVIGSLKLIGQVNGITIDDTVINLVANLLSSLAVVVGIFIGYETEVEEVTEAE